MKKNAYFSLIKWLTYGSLCCLPLILEGFEDDPNRGEAASYPFERRSYNSFNDLLDKIVEADPVPAEAPTESPTTASPSPIDSSPRQNILFKRNELPPYNPEEDILKPAPLPNSETVSPPTDVEPTPVPLPEPAPLPIPEESLPLPGIERPAVTVPRATPEPAIEQERAVPTRTVSEIRSDRPVPTTVGPINFNNVSIIEYIRFISRVSNKNFLFEDEDLGFNVTIVSEEPTSVENLIAALLQELRIRDLSLIEQGNSIIIHRNPRIRSPGQIIANDDAALLNTSELVTRVFRLNTLDPLKASEIIKPLLSDDAFVDVLRDSNNLIITDLTTNVDKIAQLIDTLDAPNSGVTVGQYVVKNGFVISLVDLATSIISPIAQGNPFVLVPHPTTNSIFIVSNPYIVEKAIAILQQLDFNESKTKVFDLNKLRADGYNPATGQYEFPPGFERPQRPLPPPLPPPPEFFPPPGIISKAPSVYNEFSEFTPGGISARPGWSQDIPTGHIERTVFFIYKLKYRRGDMIEVSLRKIANSLMATGIANADLVSAINSVQWIESSNSFIFTGTVSALEKIKDLIVEVDSPLHQVFIEMLILDTTLTDSLTYGVNWGLLFGGGDTAGGETFLTAPNQILNTLSPNVAAVPNAKPLLSGEGFNLGIIGRHLTHGGTQFSTISAMVKALHQNNIATILLNPKIITEDNVTAEVFVGSVDRYKSQSISNDEGSVLTNNFQFIDVGTTLRVTPLIGNNGIITLDIIEEVTTAAPTANTSSSNQDEVDVNLVTVLNKSRTTTRIHVPNGFFVVMSGMIQSRDGRFKNQIPCLGSIPLLGGGAKFRRNSEDKRNLMIFIRPVIVDTESELEEITRRQQDAYRQRCKHRRDWNYEIDEALDYFNVCSTDPNDGCPQLK